MKKIKNKHVLIVGPGNSIQKYAKKIIKFVELNQIVTIGIHNVNSVLVPDYHFWGSGHRWRKYGRFVGQESILIFPPGFSKKNINKYCKKEYRFYDTDERMSFDDNKKYKSIYSYFQNTGLVSILWAYQHNVSKISIVGMDGYSYYLEKQLKSKECSQHCYGKGFTDGQTYEFGRRKDIGNYHRLKMLHKYGKKKYGFGLEMLTPTVHKKFYSPNVLDIHEEYAGIEPFLKDKKKFKKRPKSMYIKNSKYW